MSEPAIKSMNLYSEVNRVYNDLRSVGINDGDAIPVEVLSQFDQYHYHGTKAVDQAIAEAGINTSSTVLDVGAGIGGPARYLAHKTGCKVVALELQEDLNQVGQDLTNRCGMAEHVQHLCGDALQEVFADDTFDAVVSWLCLYHIPDHKKLFSKLSQPLKSGGVLYAEDLFSLGEFTRSERHELETMLFGNSVHSRKNYIANVEQAGFSSVQFDDQTDDWCQFVDIRIKAHVANFESYSQIHSPEMAETIKIFYDSVSGLFNGGNLGGVRVKAVKG